MSDLDGSDADAAGAGVNKDCFTGADVGTVAETIESGCEGEGKGGDRL